MNNVEGNNLEVKIQEIWKTNKKSEELLAYCEEYLENNKSINIDTYLIYLNVLVNLKQYDKVFQVLDNNEETVNVQDVITFKLRLLFFLKKYDQCANYINNVELNYENTKLANRIMTQISTMNNATKDTEEEIKKEEIEKEKTRIEPKEAIKIEEVINKEKETIHTDKNISVRKKDKKINLKLIIAIVVVVCIVGVGIFVASKSFNNIAVNTDINLNTSGNISKYKSKEDGILYELPVGQEFEFISYFSDNQKNDNKKVYVTYKVSDESIATITEDGVFKGDNVGLVDILTLNNNNKVLNTSTVKVVLDTITNNDNVVVSANEDEIRTLIKNYKKDYIEAINQEKNSLIKKYMVEESPLDILNTKEIKELNDNGIEKKLVSFEFIDISSALDNDYLVNVLETTATIENGEETVKDYDVFYNIKVQANGTLLLYEIQSREVTKSKESKLSIDEAIRFCTDKLIETGYYDSNSGEGEYYGEAKREGYEGFYYIIYDGEEFYVDPFKCEVYFITPAGDGVVGPL